MVMSPRVGASAVGVFGAFLVTGHRPTALDAGTWRLGVESINVPSERVKRAVESLNYVNECCDFIDALFKRVP